MSTNFKTVNEILGSQIKFPISAVREEPLEIMGDVLNSDLMKFSHILGLPLLAAATHKRLHLQRQSIIRFPRVLTSAADHE